MKRAFENDFDLVPPSERFYIFKNVYEGFLDPIYNLKQNDIFFKKSSKEMSEEDRKQYILYFRSLEDRIRAAEDRIRENEKLRSLKDQKISLSNNQELFNETYREKLGKLKIKKEELFEILGFSIISFMTKNEELSEEKKS